MNLSLKFGTTACATAFALAIAGPARADRTDDDRFVGALQLYQACYYSAAYGRLAQLADGGHVEAARIALLMVRLGPQLYHTEWSATPDQIHHWIETAASTSTSSSPVAAIDLRANRSWP